MSSVNPTFEWPSLSEITLGLTPARSSCEAWEWRRSWNRMFGIFRHRKRSQYADVNAEVGQRLPSSRQQIRSFSLYSGPRNVFRFSCSWRWHYSISMAIAGSVNGFRPRRRPRRDWVP